MFICQDRDSLRNIHNHKVIISMNVSLTSERAPARVYAAFYLACQHQLYFSLPSCPARRCLHHKCQHSGIHLIHSASHSISHPPVKSRLQPHATPLFTLLLYSSSWTYASSADHIEDKHRSVSEHKIVAPPFKHWAEPHLEYCLSELSRRFS